MDRHEIDGTKSKSKNEHQESYTLLGQLRVTIPKKVNSRLSDDVFSVLHHIDLLWFVNHWRYYSSSRVMIHKLTVLILLSVHSAASRLASLVTTADCWAIALAVSIKSFLLPPSPLCQHIKQVSHGILSRR